MKNNLNHNIFFPRGPTSPLAGSGYALEPITVYAKSDEVQIQSAREQVDLIFIVKPNVAGYVGLFLWLF